MKTTVPISTDPSSARTPDASDGTARRAAAQRGAAAGAAGGASVEAAARAIPTRMLVFGMAHADGTVVSDELYPVAAACRQSAEQVRSCLRRLVAEGLFVREGSGRGARFRASPRGVALLGARRERIGRAYAQDAAGGGWDGRFRLVAFAVPEARRSARDALRDQLRALGGAALQGGLYVSPRAWEDEVQGTAARLGLAGLVSQATSSDLEVGGLREPRAIAARLWETGALGRRYAAFVDTFREVPRVLERMRTADARLPDAQLLPGALAMAVVFAGCFDGDPLLPPALLPPDWPGRAARALLRESRRLALAIREAQGRPALFRLFDETLDPSPADKSEDLS